MVVVFCETMATWSACKREMQQQVSEGEPGPSVKKAKWCEEADDSAKIKFMLEAIKTGQCTVCGPRAHVGAMFDVQVKNLSKCKRK